MRGEGSDSYFASVTEPRGVRVWYPFDGESDDDAWLSAVVERHEGHLSDILIFTMPRQRYADFPNRDRATSFVAELAATNRWRAELRA